MTPELLQVGLVVALIVWLVKHSNEVTKIGSRLEQAIQDIVRRLDKIETAVGKLSETVSSHDPVISALEARVEALERKVG